MESEDGAVLTVTTSVHGTEVVGVGAMVSILNDLDPVELRGTLVAVTAANPFAFQEGTYDTPYDHINLSGLAFREAGPGAGLTARLGGMIAPVVERSACVIDLHANPDPSIVFSLINPAPVPGRWVLGRDEAAGRRLWRDGHRVGRERRRSSGRSAAHPRRPDFHRRALREHVPARG